MILTIEAEYPSETIAKNVLAALSPDNGDYVESSLDGNTVVFTIKADSAGTMRNTADDLLACLGIAEEAAGLASAGTFPDPDRDSL